MRKGMKIPSLIIITMIWKIQKTYCKIIVKKITIDMKNNLEDLMLDETVRDSSSRKKEYYIQRSNGQLLS